MKTLSTLISDSQSLVSAKGRFGHSIPVYDDGFGPLFIHRDSMGISGIVRAQSWEDAYGICEDEFFPAADEEAADEQQRIVLMEDGEDKNHELACYDEAFGYRNNARLEKDGSLSSIYAKDLNGDSLDMLTPSLLAELEITLEIEDEEIPQPEQRFSLWHLSRKPIRGRAFVVSWGGRYGASSNVWAGYRRSMSRLSRHEHCSPTWEDTSFNPEA